MSTPGIGKAVKRREDARFLKGAGRYTDDINLPNQTYCFLLRSGSAHAKIRASNPNHKASFKLLFQFHDTFNFSDQF